LIKKYNGGNLVVAIDVIREIKHAENEAFELIEKAKKEAEKIKLDAIEEGKRIISKAEEEAQAKVKMLISQSEELAKKEAEDIKSAEEKKIHEMVSVAKVKILSLKLEDVFNILE